MAIHAALKSCIKYRNKYALNDVLNGNKCSIKHVLNELLNTIINKIVLNNVLNGNNTVIDIY